MHPRPSTAASSAPSASRLVVAILASAIVPSCGQAPRVDLAITNARVFTAAGAVLEGAEVRISGDRITSIGTDLPPAASRETIDASGMTLLPGLIDTHVHLLIPWPNELGSDEALAAHVDEDVLPRLREYLDHGVTTILSTGDYWPEIRVLRDRVGSGEVPGPRILTAGPVFTAPEGHPTTTVCSRDDAWCRSRLAVEVATAGQAREQVLRIASEGADAIKAVLGGTLGARMEPAVFTALVDAAHEVGLRVYVHPDQPADAR